MKRLLIGMLIAVSLLAIGIPVGAKHFSEWVEVNPLTDLNTARIDSCPFISKDGLSLYFASSRDSVNPSYRDLYVSQRASVDDPWGTPQPITNPNINTAGSDERCPYVTPDGRRLIFVRGTAVGDDFFMAIRRDKTDDFGWGDPVKLAVLNSPGTETAAWGFEDEEGRLILYFGASKAAGSLQLEIYQTTMDEDGNFTAPVLVSELNDPVAYDAFPVVRKDGLELYLTSNRSGGLGGMDIWVSTRNDTSEPWSTPVDLDSSINSSANEMRAALTWDAGTMVFASTRGGTWDLFTAMRNKVTGPKD